jgi:hypothetical protein
LVDAAGGIATIVLAIIALSGVYQGGLLSIATIVFGGALLIQGGTLLSEYTHLVFPSEAALPAEEFSGAGGLSTVFLVGAAGIVLGILALIGINEGVLTSVAVIAFGVGLLLSSNVVWNLHRMKHAMMQGSGMGVVSGSEILATEMASGSAVVQALGGLAAIVLGILAVTGLYSAVLSLVALLVLGATVLLTGSTLSGIMLGFMEPSAAQRAAAWTRPAE